MDTLRRAKTPPFTLVPHAFWRLRGLRPADRLVYLYLCFRADRDQTAFPSYATMAADLELSRPTVIRAVTRLLQRGLLEKVARAAPAGDRTSNLYILRDPDEVSPMNEGDGAGPAAPQEGGGGGQTPFLGGQKSLLPPVTSLNHPSAGPAPQSGSPQGVPDSPLPPNKIQLNDNQSTTTLPPSSSTSPPSVSPTSPPVVVALSTNPESRTDAQSPRERLAALVGPVLAREWLEQYGPERVSEVLRWSAAKARRNPGGFIRRALEQAWVAPPTSSSRPSQPQASPAESAEDREVRRRREEDLARKLGWWNALPAEARQALRVRLTPEVLRTSCGYPTVLAEAAWRNRGTGDETPGYLWLTAAYSLAGPGRDNTSPVLPAAGPYTGQDPAIAVGGV